MEDLGLSWTSAGLVVISTIGIYVAFLVLIRIAGQRALATMSSFDFAAAVAFGAVIGRVTLGYTPTLLAGVISLTTLFALQASFGRLRRARPVDRVISNLPLLLMANGQVIEQNLRRHQIAQDELRAKLRLSGIRRYEDVAAVILERTGEVSVLRQGETIAEDLVSDVEGYELISAGAFDDNSGGMRQAT
jgi:uncharacterized membrane protein YcaP (DUF421 family)